MAAMLVATCGHAQTYDRQAVDMFRTLDRQPELLARYRYLQRVKPSLSAHNGVLAGQMMSFALCEMGLYSQAVLNFPLAMRPIPGLELPSPPEWQGADALTTIVKQASGRRIVLINEAHHNAQTRALTLQLLPRLRQLGFTHFAAEALGDNDPELMSRGYPVKSSGTEYLQEPLYGELVREAIRLGFVVVPYDEGGSAAQARETSQAENLFNRVFAHDPNARLVVEAGYAHIDKEVGRLGKIRPMAMMLAKLTHSEPLSIDQTQFLETNWNGDDDYHRLVAKFPSSSPEILVQTATGKPWTAEPQLYDLSVISPAALSRKAFGEEEMVGSSIGRYRILSTGMPLSTELFVAQNEMQRPDWVALEGQRKPVPIDTRLCRNQVPCIVEAHYSNEPDNAIPADRYAFLESFQSTKLYLRPGSYRLRAQNDQGKTLSESSINVASQ